MLYLEAYEAHLPEFLAANLARSLSDAEKFYKTVCAEWLEAMNLPLGHAEEILANMGRLAHGSDSVLFRSYADAVSALSALRQDGFRLAVISNWDYTLHRVLDDFGFADLVEFSLASLEEGSEKPDRHLFDLAAKRLNLRTDQILHVGDNPIDDVEGASAAGYNVVLIDRTRPPAPPERISSLEQIAEVIAWIG
jgi:putative hydrolase of the HAD superfamily